LENKFFDNICVDETLEIDAGAFLGPPVFEVAEEWPITRPPTVVRPPNIIVPLYGIVTKYRKR